MNLHPALGDEWSRKYALTGAPDVHVKTDDGSVRIEAGGGAEVEARVTTEGWKIGPGEVTITENQAGDRVEIDVKLPKTHLGWGSHHRSVGVVLRVPKQAELDAHTGDGSIVLDKPLTVTGTIQSSSVRGRLGAGGEPLRIQTGDGSIRLGSL